jgi:UDPglucose--hexose-1-phosphate uridylyltransferase
MELQLNQNTHRRYNPLTGQWVLVSPHRTQRPWLGQKESTMAARPDYDPKCYLCPGNTRANGAPNPQYNSTFVFNNDYAALLPGKPITTTEQSESPFFKMEAAHGECRVICFSPRHDLTLPELPLEEVKSIINVWSEQTRELSEKYPWVQVFENKGAIMGCSNPHPHGQIWANSFLPVEIAKEDEFQYNYLQSHGTPLLLDYAHAELKDGARVISSNKNWVLPLFPVKSLMELTDDQKSTLAEIMKEGLIRYDNLFETSFPYSMGWHGAPSTGKANDHWQLHAHYYPPLLRSATIKKFMVGYEMLAEPQRDLTPEQAAQRLREVSPVHYKSKQ